MKRCATATAVLIYEVCASLFSTGILQLDLVELPSSYDETQQLALWPSSSPHSEAPSTSEVKSQNIPAWMGSLGYKANENAIVQLRSQHGSAAMVRHGHDVTNWRMGRIDRFGVETAETTAWKPTAMVQECVFAS